MSRYRVEEPSAASNTLDIYGPDGRVIGQIYGAGDPDAEHFKRFIEAHDEIVTVLRQLAEANGKWLVLEACFYHLLQKLPIDGEDAE